MNSDKVVKDIVDYFWQAPPVPSGSQNCKVYAVLDGARDESIQNILFQSPRPHHCLYFEPLTNKLRQAAPQLVELQNDAFTCDLLQHAWGNSWGIFLRLPSEIPLHKIRHQLRKLTFVRGPNKEKWLFRYYDPRVLRKFLPTCSAIEIDTFFGPLTDIMLEHENAKKLIHYHHDVSNNLLEIYSLRNNDK